MDLTIPMNNHDSLPPSQQIVSQPTPASGAPAIIGEMRMVLTAERLWDGTRMINHPIVIVDDQRVVSISTRAESDLPAQSRVLDFAGATLAPAFFDIHFHGCSGHDVMEATPEALSAIGSFLALHGTSAFLATTVTASLDATLRSLSGLAKLFARPAPEAQARSLGIHLEGPFLSHVKRGVHPPEHLCAPDIPLFDRFLEAAEGHIRLMTLAPELLGAQELAAHAVSRGVRVSLGHSNATAEETRAAMVAGAVSATHTFNAMRPLDHREPGILGTVLTSSSLFAEIVCDGIHVAPEMVSLWWKAKGPDRGILITDAISAAGMPDGEYQLGGFAVQVADGRATSRGVLAGSVLSLDRALRNFIQYTGAPLEQALPLLTANPATVTGLENQAGFIATGRPAQLVAIGADGELIGSLMGGHMIPAS
jgi:N-acetylglucosamine-6-phosphate deacetylase